MSEEKKEKIWTDCGFFEVYEDAQQKIKDLDQKYEFYKIKRVREKSKRGWFKVKAWKKSAPKKRNKSKKGKKKSD